MNDQDRQLVANRRFRSLLAHAWDRSPFYREIYAAHGIRQQDLSAVALEDLPVVSKADLMVRFDEAVTDPRLSKADLEQWLRKDVDPLNLYLDEYIVVHGSGGTKIYSYVPYTREAWRLISATTAPLLLALDRSMASPIRTAFYFWIEGHYVGATSARFASQQAHQVLSLSVFDPVEEVCARLNAFQPEQLNSYASTLAWLVEWSRQGRLRIAPRAVLASGERLTPVVRAAVRAVWNADIYDLYGACESICMAVRRPGNGDYEVLTDLNLLEVVDPTNRSVASGARGRVLLTSFVNRTLPIIRFDLHDYAILGETAMGAATLRRLDGKTYHALPVRLRDGGVGALEAHELAELELPQIAAMQFVSHSPDEVEIRYQSAHALDARIEAGFRSVLARKDAVVQKATIRRVEQISNSLPSFKLELVVKPDQRTFAPPFLAEDRSGGDAREATSLRERAPIRADDLDTPIDRRVRKIAAEHPRRRAVVDGERVLTYGELDRLASRVAGVLLDRGFDPSRPVAVFSGCRLEVVALILGALRAGGFYLPLDPNLPVQRLQTILAETAPQFLLTTAEQSAAARALITEGATVLSLEDMAAPSRKPASFDSPAAPACLLYTSGSTAGPKGVVLSRDAVRARAARYVADFGLRPTDRIALMHSHTVSASLRDIFGALLAGATLALYDVRAQGVAGIARWLEANRISVLYAVPTLFRSFLETLDGETFPAVRVVRLGGEPVQPDDVTGFREHFSPRCRLVNGYAATETDTICQYAMDHDTRIVGGRVPVGAPVTGVSVALCDERGMAVVDSLGEIRVASPMLASGYWDPRNRRVQPFPLPFATGDMGYRVADGRIFLVGRRDLVVKIHGHRIDLGELEAIASGVPGVVEAAAVLRPAAAGNSRIVVHYVASDRERAPVAELQRALSAAIPMRVVSIGFVQLPALPRLPGGKVNRAGLPAEARSAPASAKEEPRYASETEASLARIWRDVLGVTCAGRDDFFDLGGDSITVFRMLGLVEDKFGVNLPIGEFFANVALADLARAIDARRAKARAG